MFYTFKRSRIRISKPSRWREEVRLKQFPPQHIPSRTHSLLAALFLSPSRDRFRISARERERIGKEPKTRTGQWLLGEGRSLWSGHLYYENLWCKQWNLQIDMQLSDVHRERERERERTHIQPTKKKKEKGKSAIRQVTVNCNQWFGETDWIVFLSWIIVSVDNNIKHCNLEYMCSDWFFLFLL